MGPRKYSLQEITEKYGITNRTFYRYIATFRKVGIIVEQKDGLYQIKRIEARLKELSELLHFSEEEAIILNNAIFAIDDNNQLKANLRKKLFSIYDFDRIPETIVHPEQAKSIQSIIHAIKNRKQIILKKYQSANSQIISDRLVEAFDISSNYQMIWAYDQQSKQNKQFKISRIKKVELLNTNWEQQIWHKKLPLDVFRISGTKAEECVLKMSLRAGNLLTEEYPLAQKMLKQLENNTFLFQAPIYSYYGVGRFCMGLLSDIEVIEPKGLKIYIEEKLKEFLKK
jgi:predicted DNA-binding transcriptional regulator YafY